MNVRDYIQTERRILEKWCGTKIPLDLFKYCIDYCIYYRVRNKIMSKVKMYSLDFLLEIRNELGKMRDEARKKPPTDDGHGNPKWGDFSPTTSLERYPDE